VAGSATRSQSIERSQRIQQSTVGNSNSSGGYAVLSKSKSSSSLAETGGNMLKDLDTALKASTNYIESHRVQQLPNGHQEYHEYRSQSTSGNMPRNGMEDFNLERQVQHMMPSAASSGLQQSYSGLQSANMVSSMQTSTSKSSYTSYKVQSNSYTSSSSGNQQRVEYDQQQQVSSGGERPGSRLKANIDELDTLLSDLNNAQNSRSTSQHQHHETSSEDYGD